MRTRTTPDDRGTPSLLSAQLRAERFAVALAQIAEQTDDTLALKIARAAFDSEARREHLEAHRLARRHVTTGNRLGFTYRPTPPSGPPPKDES